MPVALRDPYSKKRDTLQMNCKYTYEFPVDKWDRLGGIYSLADVPVARFKNLTRPGVVIAVGDKAYKVRDYEEGFVRWVPTKDVEISEDSSTVEKPSNDPK